MALSEVETKHSCIGSCPDCRKTGTFNFATPLYNRMRNTGAIAVSDCMDKGNMDDVIQFRSDTEGTVTAVCSARGTDIFLRPKGRTSLRKPRLKRG